MAAHVTFLAMYADGQYEASTFQDALFEHLGKKKELDDGVSREDRMKWETVSRK